MTKLQSEVTESAEGDDNKRTVIRESLKQSIQFDDLRWVGKLMDYDLSLAVHSLRVASLAARFSRHLRLPERQIRRLHRAALLHDVEKLCISLELLHKPGELDETEWDLLRKHPSLGAELLRDFGETDAKLLQLVQDHHERINGTGYPAGADGSRLNMDVRILSLCDVFVACTEIRPYVKVLCVAEGCDLVRQERLGLDHGLAIELVGMVERESSARSRAAGVCTRPWLPESAALASLQSSTNL